MDEDEKEPYKVLQRLDTERFLREEEMLARGEKISAKTEEEWKESLKQKAAVIFRGLTLPSQSGSRAATATPSSSPLSSVPSSLRSSPAPASEDADAVKAMTGVFVAATTPRSATPTTGSAQSTASTSPNKSSRGTLKERDTNSTVPRSEKAVHEKIASKEELVKEAVSKELAEDIVGKENVNAETIGKTNISKPVASGRKMGTNAKKDAHNAAIYKEALSEEAADKKGVTNKKLGKKEVACSTGT
jgi:hypothetical protein